MVTTDEINQYKKLEETIKEYASNNKIVDSKTREEYATLRKKMLRAHIVTPKVVNKPSYMTIVMIQCKNSVSFDNIDIVCSNDLYNSTVLEDLEAEWTDIAENLLYLYPNEVVEKVLIAHRTTILGMSDYESDHCIYTLLEIKVDDEMKIISVKEVFKKEYLG